MKILPCGDCALTVELGDSICPETGAVVRGLSDSINAARVRGVIELIPAFRSVTVCYDPVKIGFDRLAEKITLLASRNDAETDSGGRVFVIPVCYDGEYACDLDSVSELTGLGRDEIVKRHTAPDYRIYMLGFLPGFPYLGGLDKTISAPRLDSPRKEIPAGAVGIGGEQTGIYPIVSPGGWRLIGRTPVKVYDPERANPVLYSAGDYIRFRRVDKAEYEAVAEKVKKGEYNVEIVERT